MRERGALTALWLFAWVRRRRVVVLELIPRGPSRSRWRALLRAIAWWTVERPAIRRAMLAGQVLTWHEREDDSRRYGVPPTRLQFIPWALSPGGDPAVGDRSGVLASGRAACDWETLFEAARGAGWELTVVCGPRDLESVSGLNRGGTATVLSDIPWAEHDEILRRSAVYVLALRDQGISAGQV